MESPERLVAVETRRGVRYHRPTCTRIRFPVGDANSHPGGQPATCCKPTMAPRSLAGAKAGGARAKVQANADKVQRINEAEDAMAARKARHEANATPPTVAEAMGDAAEQAQAAAERAQARSRRGPRGQQAIAVRKANNNKRGRGTKVSDDALNAHIAHVQATHPESSLSDELEYAYWVLGWAFSADRFKASWARQAPAAKAS